jgi:hypothetical protein
LPSTAFAGQSMTDSRNIMSLRGFPPWRVIHTQGKKPCHMHI